MRPSCNHRLLKSALAATIAFAIACNGSGGDTGPGPLDAGLRPDSGNVRDGSTTGMDGSTDADDGAVQGNIDNLGAACASDTDCGGALTCTLPTDVNNVLFGGGPANGYCTKTCATDADCSGNSVDGMCINDGAGHSVCLLTCTQGPPLQTVFDEIMDPTKCLARTDVACEPASSTVSVCVPMCGVDSRCPAGLHCDPASNACVATPHTGLAKGQPCDPDAGAQCAGFCLDIGNGASVCSQGCELGTDPAHANDPFSWTACGGLANGLCAFFDPNVAGAGDYAYCTGACSKQSDCDNPATFCLAIPGLTGKNGITNGWCMGAAPCPNGQGDCPANSGLTCTQTAYGPLCLSSQFPP
jgi:hypothetical protein